MKRYFGMCRIGPKARFFHTLPGMKNLVAKIGPIGYEKNGLSGGICNVIYYPGALSRLKIGMYYETLKNQNPPVLPDCPI